MLRSRQLLAVLHLLLAVMACVALVGAPLASFSTARGVIIEENEEKTERTERTSSSASTPWSAAPVASRRLERRAEAEHTVDDLRGASRHAPGVLAAHPPRPNPGWLRPIRC
jgi:hypothetical protein